MRLLTRNGQDWSGRFPWIAESAPKNRHSQFVIDGEAVILGVDGIADFNGLHSRQHDEVVQLYAFDILAFDGEDLRGLPLSASAKSRSAHRPKHRTTPFDGMENRSGATPVLAIRMKIDSPESRKSTLMQAARSEKIELPTCWCAPDARAVTAIRGRPLQHKSIAPMINAIAKQNSRSGGDVRISQ